MRKSLFRFFASFTIAIAFALPSTRALARSFTTFDPPGSIGTIPTGINFSGWITGYYFDASLGEHGFVRAPTGSIATFDPPDSVDTVPASLNSSGTITGNY